MNILVVIIIIHALCLRHASAFFSLASIEAMIERNEVIGTSKFLRGQFSSAGTVINVEGLLQQVHPLSLCSEGFTAPMFGNIYVVKIEGAWAINTEEPFCRSAAEKARLAIEMGANAVILVVTERLEQSMQELSSVWPSFSRPVLIIDNETEEQKLLAVLTSGHRAYARINPIPTDDKPSEWQENLQVESNLIEHRERLTYTGVAVIFAFVVILLVLGAGVMCRLRSVKLHSQEHVRRELLSRIGTTKYQLRRSQRKETCPICLEQFVIDQEIRLLPCSHKFHRVCIDPWLMSHETCPCCCSNVNDMIQYQGYALSRSREATKSRTGLNHEKLAAHNLLTKLDRFSGRQSSEDRDLLTTETLIYHDRREPRLPSLNQLIDVPCGNPFIGKYSQGCPQEQADPSCLDELSLPSLASFDSSPNYHSSSVKRDRITDHALDIEPDIHLNIDLESLSPSDNDPTNSKDSNPSSGV